jgi:hypothetical protein
MPARRRPLLLPPHHPETRSPQQPALHLRNPPPGRPVSDPALYRPGPPAHRRQRHRPPPRRSPPLRPPDRKPQPSQTRRPPQCQTRPRRSRRRDHHRPRTGHPRPTRRSRPSHRAQKLRCQADRENHAGRSRQVAAGDKHSAHPQRRDGAARLDSPSNSSPQSHFQRTSSPGRTEEINRRIHHPLLSFLNRWPPSPNPPEPPL